MSYKQSFKTSVQTAWVILKLIVPIYIFAEVIYYYNLLSHIAFLLEPIASLLHLPKEATLAIISGMFLNLYAAIAFAAPLGLNAQEWTILAIFLGVCHSLIVETAVMKKIGINVTYSILLRIVGGFIIAYPIVYIPQSYFAQQVVKEVSLKTYENLMDVLSQSLVASLSLSVKVIILISAIIFLMDFIKNLSFIKNSKKNVSTGFTLAVGVVLGITYGAGILIKEVQAKTMSKEEVFYVATFLMICHAIIEDTLLFVIFNADLTLILIARIVGATILSYVLLLAFRKRVTS
jgi:hypothetical protein